MDYSVEEISPVKKKINVAFAPEEVDRTIGKIVSSYKKSATLDGFRKGKVPASVIEKRFHGQIYDEAREDLINSNIKELVEKLQISPVSRINLEGADKLPEKGSSYSYSFDFEVLPEFEIPNYQGLEVEQDSTVLDKEEIAKILESLRRDEAQIVPLETSEPAKDGQIVNIDYEVYENGEPLRDIKAKNYELELGQGIALPDFEEFVKTILPGGEASRDIKFPADFPVASMAGKTLEMHVKVNSVSERKLPELDDALAKKLGFENQAALVEAVEKSFLDGREKLNRGVAQKKLLDILVKQTDYPLPTSMVEDEKRFLLGDLAIQLEQQGRTWKSLGKSLDELREEMHPQAEALARNLVLLLSIAKKEGLSVSDQEATLEILKNCLKNGQDFRAVREEYERSGMLHLLKEKMTADKAMDFIYNKANVKFTGQSGEEGQKLEGQNATPQPGEAENNPEPVSEKLDAGTNREQDQQ